MGEEFFRNMQQRGGSRVLYPGLGAPAQGLGEPVYFPATGSEAAAGVGARPDIGAAGLFGAGRVGAGEPGGAPLLSSLLAGLGGAGTAVYGGAAALMGRRGKIPFAAIPVTWLDSPRYAAFVRELIAQGIVEAPTPEEAAQTGAEAFVPPAQEETETTPPPEAPRPEGREGEEIPSSAEAPPGPSEPASFSGEASEFSGGGWGGDYGDIFEAPREGEEGEPSPGEEGAPPESATETETSDEEKGEGEEYGEYEYFPEYGILPF